MAKKDWKMELTCNISKASFIPLFIFLIIWYLSTHNNPRLSILINDFNNTTLSIFIVGLFFINLALLYKTIRNTLTNILTKILTYLEKHNPFPENPYFIMGLGCFLLLVVFLFIMLAPPIASFSSTIKGKILMFWTLGGFVCLFFGILSFIVGFSARTYKKLPRLSEWIHKSKDTIFQDIGLIVSIFSFILAALQAYNQLWLIK